MIWAIIALCILIIIFMIVAFNMELNTREQDHEFELWAFGREAWEEYKKRPFSNLELMHAWNRLHGDKLKLEAHHRLTESAKKMREIWEQSK